MLLEQTLQSVLDANWYPFLLILARVGGTVAVLPAVGSAGVPVRTRALIAVLIAGVAHAFVPNSPIYLDIVQSLAAVSMEAVIGVSLGIVPAIILLGLRLASQLMSRMTGVSIFDQSESQLGASAIERLFVISAIAIFLAIGGHRQIIDSLLQSFRMLPIGESTTGNSYGSWLATVLSESFRFGVRFAAPVAITLVASNSIVGLVSKSLPQFNALTVGTSFNLTLLLIIMFLSIGALSVNIEGQLDDSLRYWIVDIQTEAP